MKRILRSLIEYPSEKKWAEYLTSFSTFFGKRDPHYDEIIEFIREYYAKFAAFPSKQNIGDELGVNNEEKLLNYIEHVFDPSVASCKKETDFFTLANLLETSTLELDILGTINSSVKELPLLKKRDVESLKGFTEKVTSNLTQNIDKVSRYAENTSSYMYGDEAVKELEDIYIDRLEKKNDLNHLYYNLGYDSFSDIKMKMGDLIFFGGFISHGKSILLREISYRFITEYALNVAFFSFEVSHNIVRTHFSSRHANNKKIHPNTPLILDEKIKEATLSDEEYDFLFHTSNKDLANNEEYGTLYIDQPGKSKYTINDLSSKIKEIENSVMPIHVVVLDYITLMSPFESGRNVRTDRSDVNQMIKDFKSLALNHKNSKGELAPFIAITAAQISRDGVNRAIKNELNYDIAAFADYSEIERSSDILLTSLMTGEMRESSQIRLQNLKNRDGKVVLDPIDLHVDLRYGYQVSQLSTMTTEETVQQLQDLNI